MRQLPSFIALRAFEAAARLQSFALAGEELHLTPSAISHQVRSLEAYFGRPLFHRHYRRAEASADGRRLLADLTTTFDALEAACAEFGRMEATEALALHCGPSFASKWLGPRLPAFMRLHPEISIRLSASADPIDLARNETLDLVISYGEPPSRRGIVAEPLGTEIVMPLISPALDARWNRGDWGGLTLIESAVSPVKWADWFGLNGIAQPKARPSPSFDRGALAISAAVQGLGAVLETTRFAEEELAKGELVPLGGSELRPVRRDLHFLCYRRSQRDAAKITAFREWLFAAIAEGERPA